MYITISKRYENIKEEKAVEKAYDELLKQDLKGFIYGVNQIDTSITEVSMMVKVNINLLKYMNNMCN